MQELRNATIEEAVDADECSLFDDAPKMSKKRRSKGLMDSARQHPQIVDIPLKLQDKEEPIVVRVVKAVHPNDCFWIEFNDEHISAAIQFMIEGGFTEDSRRKRPLDEKLPIGVHRRGSGFRIQYTHDGACKYKCVGSMHDALAFHADPEAYLIAEAEATRAQDEESDHEQAEEAE